MSLESVAREAETTVPSLRRRYRDKSTLAAAVVDSIRVEAPHEGSGPPRDRALAVLENFSRNLERPHSMALLGTLLAEEHRTPELIKRFRSRLVRPRSCWTTCRRSNRRSRPAYEPESSRKLPTLTSPSTC